MVSSLFATSSVVISPPNRITSSVFNTFSSILQIPDKPNDFFGLHCDVVDIPLNESEGRNWNAIYRASVNEVVNDIVNETEDQNDDEF